MSETGASSAEFGLEGKSVVIVGSGPGIGRAIAEAFNAAGAKVACLDLDLDVARETAEIVGGVAYRCDVLDRSTVRGSLAEAANTFGSIDVLIDVVGIAHAAAFLDLDDDSWHRSIELNLTHQYIVNQEALRLMAKQRSGAIVSIASIAGLSSAPGRAGYGAAKAGLISLIRSMAVEAGPLGVRVNGVAPGPTKTPRLAHLDDGESGDTLRSIIPLARLGNPDDVASVVLFLGSNLARYVTGQTIPVDGGVSVRYFVPPLDLTAPGH